MESISVPVGADVSERKIDVSVAGGKPMSFSNRRTGLEALLRRLPEHAAVYMECTGAYGRLLVRLLRQAGVPVFQLDPLQVRRYAQATGRQGKTDALDARVLAWAGPLLRPVRSKSEEHEGLADVSRRIGSLKASRAADKRRLGQPGLHPCAAASLRRGIQSLDREIARLEREFASLVRSSSLARRYALLLSVPGVGPALARTLACELPGDLEGLDSGNVASYAGLAPMDRQSGNSRKPSRIRKGNRRLKAALYMPALACVRFQDWAKTLYRRLKGSGKTHAQAIAAVMRRLLVRAFAVLRHDRPWQNCQPGD